MMYQLVVSRDGILDQVDDQNGIGHEECQGVFQ